MGMESHIQVPKLQNLGTHFKVSKNPEALTKYQWVHAKQYCQNTQSVGMAAIERWLPAQIANAAAF